KPFLLPPQRRHQVQVAVDLVHETGVGRANVDGDPDRDVRDPQTLPEVGLVGHGLCDDPAAAILDDVRLLAGDPVVDLLHALVIGAYAGAGVDPDRPRLGNLWVGHAAPAREPHDAQEPHGHEPPG